MGVFGAEEGVVFGGAVGAAGGVRHACGVGEGGGGEGAGEDFVGAAEVGEGAEGGAGGDGGGGGGGGRGG